MNSRSKQVVLTAVVCLICFHTNAGAFRRQTGAVHAFLLTADGFAVMGGQDRAWVSKRTLEGDEELFRVQLGSDSRDAVHALASGADGRLYAAGAMFLNGVEHGFLATLDASGKRISFTLFSTTAYALAVDVDGRFYVAGDGYVQLPNGRRIAPPGPVRALAIGGDGTVYAAGRRPSTVETGSYGDDAYVARLSADQSHWDWVLPLGGTGAVEEARAIAFDAQGAIYVAGVTNSVDFPVKAAYQHKLYGPQDAFLVKLIPEGRHVEWATYLGGLGTESIAALVVDGNGEILLAGSTNSPDFPSAGRWAGDEDGFLARFGANGKLIRSDYLVSVAGSSHVEILLRSVAKPAARMAGTTSSSIVLTTTPNPSILGAPVTLIATVTAGATGKVTFYDGTTMLSTATVGANTATLSTILLPSGTRSLRAYYGGDSIYSSSTSAAVTQTVIAKPAGGFLNTTNYRTGIGPVSVEVGDFNGDGKADLAVANSVDYFVSILLGNGNGTFQPAVNYAAGLGPQYLKVADFNGDGKADLAFTHSNESSLSILFGNGDGTFQPAVTYNFGTTQSFDVGDFNSDGKPDLAVMIPHLRLMIILIGNGDGTFQSPVIYEFDYNVDSAVVGDFNGDGKPDLAVIGSIGRGVVVNIWLGNGDGTFQSGLRFGAGSFAGGVAVGDFNGDGKADLVVTNYGGPTATIPSGAVVVLLGNGDGTFQSALTYGVGTSPSRVAVGDFNGDGKPDLALTNYQSNNVSILYGNGNGTFQASINYGVGESPGALAVGDFSGDGKADLAVANFVSKNISILLSENRPSKIGVTYSGYSALDLNGSFAWEGPSVDRLIFWSTGQAGEIPIYGDWNGDGKTKAGVYLNGTWLLDLNGNGVWDGPSVDKSFYWGTGRAGEVPIYGDWNGDGRTKAGVYVNGTWILDYNGNGVWDGPSIDKSIYWSTGLAGEVPVIGDWNGDGKTKIGVYLSGTWRLDYNGNYAWDFNVSDKTIFLGGPGYTPVVGDWNGSGWSKIGAYLNGTWVLDYDGNFAWNGTLIDTLTYFGGPEYVPVVGDWNGSGRTKIGAYANGLWLLDLNGNFFFDQPTDRIFFYGGPGQTPIAGRW